jgi:threonine dehydrogenase-like Zn-dependent dehydrogenase
MVQTGVRQLEMREFPLPEIGDDDGLLKIEACGICGSDWAQYQGEYTWLDLPVVPGHEPVGIVERLGRNASKRWGVSEGDRVVVEPLLPCGFCRQCIQGEYSTCTGYGRVSCYAYIPISVAPGLWGGYADYLYLDPHALVHKIDPKVPVDIAALYNPLGSGIHWGVHRQGTTVGDSIVILGCGQRGLCSVIAAKEAGASMIIVTGLERDAHKLKLARQFGADHTVAADKEDVVEAVMGILPTGADVVLDTTPNSPESVNHALDMVARSGTIGLAGVKGTHAVNNLRTDLIMQKNIRVLGTKGAPWRASEAAIRMIESGRYPLEKLHTHTIPLEETARALEILAGEVDGEQPIHITIRPEVHGSHIRS